MNAASKAALKTKPSTALEPRCALIIVSPYDTSEYKAGVPHQCMRKAYKHGFCSSHSPTRLLAILVAQETSLVTRLETHRARLAAARAELGL